MSEQHTQDIAQISSIFPSTEKSVIEAVYESNSNSLELTVSDLLKMTEEAPSNASSSPTRKLSTNNKPASRRPSAKRGRGYSASGPSDNTTTVIGEETTAALPPLPPQRRMTIEEQLAVDEALAFKLQQREAERHHANEVTRDIAEKLGLDPDDSEFFSSFPDERANFSLFLDSEPGEEFKFIAEMAKKGKREDVIPCLANNTKSPTSLGVENVKTAVRRLSRKLSTIARRSSDASTTPRTMQYTSLPTNDFDHFLNDNNDGPLREENSLAAQPGPSSGTYQSPAGISPPGL